MESKNLTISYFIEKEVKYTTHDIMFAVFLPEDNNYSTTYNISAYANYDVTKTCY